MRNGRFKRLVRAFEECEIDDGMKREVLDMLEELYEKKEFGLVWNKERTVEDVVKDCENKVPILEKVHEKSIAKEGNIQNNIFIEGDNYHSLQVLNQTHRGKIDVIYIDPPYNTKNKDFIYNDKRVDAEDDYRHSKWLSFMDKRLRLAKDLLSEKGVIFISIDDNEQANLRLLCDEIFGEENFVANLVWTKKNKTSGVPPVNLSLPNKEYVLVYKKSVFKFKGVAGSKKSYKKDSNGNYYRTMPIQATGKQDNWFNIVNPENGNKHYGNWAFSAETIKKKIKSKEIMFPQKETQKPVQIVYYNEEKKSPIFHYLGLFDSETETKEFNKIGVDFDFPKPLNLIKFLLEQSSSKDGTILDFFAGSGTTGHAVLELNKEDGGDRRFILCTNNENNNGNGSGGIAESVCYPRIQKVIEGYKKNGDGEEVAGLGGGLEYFKTDFVDVNTRAMTDVDKLKVSKKVGYILGMRHDCFEETHLNDFYHILEREDFGVFIYFEESLREFRNFQEHIRGKKGVLYSYAGNTKKGFGIEEDDTDYTDITLEKIPEQFIAVYRNCIS